VLQYKREKRCAISLGRALHARFFEKIPLATRIGLVQVEKNQVELDVTGAREAFDWLLDSSDLDKL